MLKSLVTIAGALVIGFLIGNYFGSDQESPVRNVATASKTAEIPFDYQPPPPTMTVSEAADLRENNYQDIKDVDGVLELPSDFSQTEALYLLAGRADEGGIQDLIVQSMNITDRYDRAAALRILFDRYIEINPDGAVNFLLEIDLDVYDRVIDGMFGSWAKLDLQAAIAGANGIGNAARRKKAGYAVLHAIARTDPGMMDAVAAQLEDHHNVSYLVSEAIGIRANYDPETALYEALNLNNRNSRFDAIWRVGHVWARNDPVTALNYAESITDPMVRDRFMNSVFNRWISDDPETAMQSILTHPQLGNNDQYLIHALSNYANNDPLAAVALIPQLETHMQDQAYQTVYQNWANTDPDGAMQELVAMTDSPRKTNLIQSMVQSISQSEPEAAFTLLESLPVSDRERMLPNIIGQFAYSDPHRALELAKTIQSAGNRQRAITTVIGYLTYSSPEMALQFVNELPAGQNRNQLYSNIATGWARKDPQAALAWIGTLSGKAHEQAIQGVARQIAQSDPQLAASLIGQVSGENRSMLIQNIAQGMSHRDPRQALSWLNQFRKDPGYGQAAASVATNLARQDPHAAMRLAASLVGSNRTNAVSMVLNQWSHGDPAAAARWAATSDSDVRMQAVTTVTTAWSQTDPVAATQWAKSLRSGEAKDHAMVTLVSSGQIESSQYVSLINAIDSDNQRDNAIVRAYMVLVQQQGDKAAADRLLDRLDAGDSVRRQVRNYTGG